MIYIYVYVYVCVCICIRMCVCLYIYNYRIRRKNEKTMRWKDLEQGRPEQGDEWIEEEGTRFSRGDSMTSVS